MTTRILTLLIFTFVINAPIFAQMDSVLNCIVENNLALKALRHSQAADVLDIRSDNALGGPSIEYSPFYQSGYNGVASSELIVSEEFDFPTQYAQRRKQASLQSDANAGEYESARRSLMLDAELICIDVIRLNQLADLLQRRQQQSEEMQSMFQKRMDAGDANILELNKAKLTLMDVKKSVVATENERAELLLQLQSLNGGNAVVLSQRSFPDYSDIQIDNPDLIARSLANDPDVQAAQANTRLADHSLSMSRQSWLPSISVGYRRNTERSEALNGFMVGASFPLFNTASKVKSARQRQLAAQLQLTDVQTQKEAELRTLCSELARLRQVLDHSDTDLLLQTLALLDKALTQGEITALQYYTEVSDIYADLETHIDTHAKYCKALARVRKNL